MLHSVAIIAVAAIVTLIIRAVPFVAFDGKREVPETVTYLGKVLPPAIMVILVIYCVKGINLFTGSHGIPELLSIAVVALLHIWKKNTLLSIAVGTIPVSYTHLDVYKRQVQEHFCPAQLPLLRSLHMMILEQKLSVN